MPVEFHRRTLSLFYYVAAICFVILVSVVFFAAAERAERWLKSVG